MTATFFCSEFPSNLMLNGLHIASVPRHEFIRSLISVGYASRYDALLNVGIHRARMLAEMALGYLDENLRTTEYFSNLEQSEKAATSFLFAQAATHWFAQNYMGMHCLLHVSGAGDYVERARDVPLTWKKGSAALKERGRPDFIGISSEGFHIFETKGRSSGSLTESLIQTALAQVSKIYDIMGHHPITRVAACFRFSDQGLHAVLRDPPPRMEAYNLFFDEKLALRKYYAIFFDEKVSLIEDKDRGIIGTSVSENLFFGIDIKVYESLDKFLRQPHPMSIFDFIRILENRKQRITSKHPHQTHRGFDGIELISRNEKHQFL